MIPTGPEPVSAEVGCKARAPRRGDPDGAAQRAPRRRDASHHRSRTHGPVHR